MQSNIKNKLNPFICTARDVNRTGELSKKNPVLTGAITFFFFPAGLFYLNRGINTLKIIGYLFTVTFLLNMVTDSNQKLKDFIELIAIGAITTEQVLTINKARQRLKENPSLISDNNSILNEKEQLTFDTNQDAVQQIKLLKERYNLKELSEEEFKVAKQNILNSL